MFSRKLLVASALSFCFVLGTANAATPEETAKELAKKVSQAGGTAGGTATAAVGSTFVAYGVAFTIVAVGLKTVLKNEETGELITVTNTSATGTR